MDLNNLIIFFVLIIFSLFFYKYFPIFLNKYNLNILIDDELKKPQAFHEFPISTSGGLGIFFSFLILYSYLYLFNHEIYYDFLTFCSLFFFLGLSDDLKLNIKPKFRLGLMILFLITLAISNNFFIENTGNFIIFFIKYILIITITVLFYFRFYNIIII